MKLPKSRDILTPDPTHPHVLGGVTHICATCGRDFIPKVYWQRFCCDACRRPVIDDLA